MPRRRAVSQGPAELPRPPDFMWAEDEADFRNRTGKQFQKVELDEESNQWLKLFEEHSLQVRLTKPVMTVFWSGGAHAVERSPFLSRHDPVRIRRGITFCGLEFTVDDRRVGASSIKEVGCPICQAGIYKARM